jgi:hypothetical protein
MGPPVAGGFGGASPRASTAHAPMDRPPSTVTTEPVM